MKAAVFLFSLLLVRSFCDPIPQKDCEKTYPTKINSIDVMGCDMNSICKITKGVNTTVKVSFTPDSNYTTMDNGVFGKIGGSYMAFPGFNERAVCSLGVKCPVTPGQMVAQTLTLEVNKLFPPIEVLVQWRMYNEPPTSPNYDPSKMIACTMVVLQLV